MFEVDKIYTTTFQTKDKFLIKKIERNHKGDIVKFWGYYGCDETSNLCPLNADLLTPEQSPDMDSIQKAPVKIKGVTYWINKKDWDALDNFIKSRNPADVSIHPANYK